MSFKSRVYELMEAHNLTAGGLERKAGISNGVIGKWTDESLPTVKNLLTLANYFNVSTDYLLDRDENRIDSGQSKSEAELLLWFRRLADEQQSIIISTVKGLAGNPDCTKKAAANETA